MFALALFIAASALAQTDFKIGLTGGMNVSKMQTSLVNMDNKVGWHAGLIGELSFENNFYGNLSVLYSNKGFKYEENDDGDTFTTTQQANYVEIPIHVGYKYPVSNKVKFIAEAGPCASILTSAKVTEEEWCPHAKEGDKESYKNDKEFNSFDIGLGFKTGFEFSDRFRITLGYDWGLSNIAKEGIKTHNRNFTVGMVLFF